MDHIRSDQSERCNERVGFQKSSHFTAFPIPNYITSRVHQFSIHFFPSPFVLHPPTFPPFHPHLFREPYFVRNSALTDTSFAHSPSVSVRPPAMVLFITFSSLPRALGSPRALPSRNDQMWPGPCSRCQQRTGGHP